MADDTPIIDTLAQHSVFRGCSDETLRLLALADPERVVIQPEQQLCCEGDYADSWWVILAGEGLVTSAGKPVGTVTAADTVGELALLHDQPRSATVTATTALDAIELDRSTFMEALNTSPQLSANILLIQTKRIHTANDAAAA